MLTLTVIVGTAFVQWKWQPINARELLKSVGFEEVAEPTELRLEDGLSILYGSRWPEIGLHVHVSAGGEGSVTFPAGCEVVGKHLPNGQVTATFTNRLEKEE